MPRPDTHTADVIVVGLGAMGSATCAELAARGVDVIGIDRHQPPHLHGSTHGDTRITRLAIGEGAEYVPLVRRSHELWRELELEAGARLLHQVGGLVLGHPSSEFLEQTRASARRYRIAYEDLTAADIAERFPMFKADERTVGYFEPDAGYVRPEAAVSAQLQIAGRRGARLHVGECVEQWSASGTGVAVRTHERRYEGDRLVLCAGPWIRELFPEGAGIFAVYRQLMHWFPIRERYERLRDMPIFIWDLGGASDGFIHLLCLYGFPAIDGPGGGVKVATETYERATTPDDPLLPATRPEGEELYRRLVEPHVNWLGPEPIRSASCLYTNTRGSRFVIDLHPEHERVVIVSACSGHGFKHSPAIGEAVAQLLTDGTSDVDLSQFALALTGTGDA